MIECDTWWSIYALITLFFSFPYRDLISLGGNHSIHDVTGQKRMFLYRLNAPTIWEDLASFLDPNAGETNSEKEYDIERV